MLASAPSELRLPLAVVVHDAGAANLILGWIATLPPDRIRLCAAGPAELLFTANRPQIRNLPLDEVLVGAAMLLSGTSGLQSSLEHNARRIALTSAITCIGVIDHWVNYVPRFTRDGEQILPDEIWVTDDHAVAIARGYFPGCPVYRQPNRYLENLVVEASAASQSHANVTHVLYALEPMHSTWNRGKVLGEFQALEFFLEKGAQLGLDASAQIRLRPHPSDPVDKYADWLSTRQDSRLVIDAVTPLPQIIGWSDWVVGCESYALVAGLAAGRRVISCLPPWAPTCRLPHPEIIKLRDL